MPWPMTDSESIYRPPQMTRLNASNKTPLEICRDIFIPPFDASGLRNPRTTRHVLLITTSPELMRISFYQHVCCRFRYMQNGRSNGCASFESISGTVETMRIILMLQLCRGCDDMYCPAIGTTCRNFGSNLGSHL